MKKNDNRNYNRQLQRDLNLEMNLWCFVVGKDFHAENPTLRINGSIPGGRVVDFALDRISPNNLRGKITFENGVVMAVPVKHRKLVGIVLSK